MWTKVVLVVVMMLGFVGFVQAANTVETYFYSGGSTGDWSNPAVWVVPADGTVPLLASFNDIAIVNNGGTLNVTTSGQGCGQFWLGYGDNSFGASTINVAAGISFSSLYTSVMGYGGPGSTATGILNIGEGGSFSCAQLLISYVAGTHGIVTVANGGTLTAGAFQVGGGDTASVSLAGTGSMVAYNPLTIGDGSHIDMQAGTIRINGDAVASCAALIAAGKITAYGGAGTVNAPVLGTDGWTQVTATPEPATMILLGLGGLLLRRRMA